MAHTPGPWWVDGPGEGIEVHDTFGRTASVWGDGGEDSEAWANARLIAAAPELLAGLKAAVESLLELAQYEEAAKEMVQTGWFDGAAKAIDKAEGRTDDQ